MRLLVDDAGWDGILACIGNGGIPMARGTRQPGFGAPQKQPGDLRVYCPRPPLRSLSFAKNASAGIALRRNAFITVMQAAEVRNLDDPSDTRDLPCMWTLLVES